MLLFKGNSIALPKLQIHVHSLDHCISMLFLPVLNNFVREGKTVEPCLKLDILYTQIYSRNLKVLSKTVVSRKGNKKASMTYSIIQTYMRLHSVTFTDILERFISSVITTILHRLILAVLIIVD